MKVGSRFLIFVLISIWFVSIPVAGAQVTPVGQDSLVAKNTDNPSARRLFYIRQYLFDLERSFDVYFNFDDDLLKDKFVYQEIEMPGSIAEMEGYLKELLSKVGLTFLKIDGKMFIIIEKAPERGFNKPFKPLEDEQDPEPDRSNLSNTSNENEIDQDPVQITVQGRVTDAYGDVLAGVNIIVKGTLLGTTTDNSGNFSIRFSSEYKVLQFSYLGFATREVMVSDGLFLNIELEALAITGEELIVIGYGSQKRRDLTGSVGSLNGDQIRDMPYLSVEQTLQGRLSGVQVIPASGKPGGAISVRIRGTGTINDSEPLYVIDGFPVSGGISAFNVDDIASIDVLKDASAAAIYGARGANGVVIITTKRGLSGKMEVDLSFYSGFQEVAEPIRMLNASQYAELNNEARTNGGETRLNPAFVNPSAVPDSASWMNEIFRIAPMENYSASIRGGTEALRYNLSGGYLRQKGIIIGSGFERKSFRLNLDSEVSPIIHVGNSLSYSMSTFQNEGGGHLVRSAMSALPTQPVRRFGNFSGPEGIAEFEGDVINPVGISAINDFADDKHRLLNNLFFNVQPFTGLLLRSEFGIDLGFERTRNWSPKYRWGVKEQTHSSLYEGSYERLDWLWDNTITYTGNIEDHHFTVLGGISAQKSSNKFIGATGQEFVSDIANQLDNIQSNESVFGSTSEFGLLAYIGRVNYSYMSKYLITATARYDGSSRFGRNNRYGLFPSASVAWRISQEQFMPDIPFLEDLKIRAGYGVTGNQNSIPAFGYIALLDPTYRYSFGNISVPAAVPQNFPNDDLRWEKVKQSNIAMDFILFGGRVNLTAEYYLRDTEDMLIQSPIPITTGFFDAERPIINVGAVRNSGFEFALNTSSILLGIRWVSDLNMSFNDNKILRLSGPDGDDPIIGGEITFNKFASRMEVGRPVGAFYGHVTDGLFQNLQEVHSHATQTVGTNPSNSTSPGDIRFKDLNGDGVIDDNDRTYLGNPNPDFFYGWTNSLSYKNFDLSIFIQGVYGNKVFNANKVFSEAMATAQNQTVNTLNRWRGEGTSNSVPRATTTDPNNNQRVSDRYIEDGSFLRIKNVTLGYQLPDAVSRRLTVRQLRVYASAQNLYTFTKYNGFDPEVGVSGIDDSVYPPSRIVTAGINIGF